MRYTKHLGFIKYLGIIKKSHFDVYKGEIYQALWDRLKNPWRFAEHFEIKTHFEVYEGESHQTLGMKSTFSGLQNPLGFEASKDVL